MMTLRKPTMQRLLLITGCAALLLALAAYLLRVPLAMALVAPLAAHRLAIDTATELPDGLHVGLCGSGSPFPDENRGGPCTLVLAGQRLFVFDAGNMSARNIGRMGFPHGHIEALFLTHFHSDHIDGLGELLLQRWVAGSKRAPLPVFGPAGVEQIVQGLALAYHATPEQAAQTARDAKVRYLLLNHIVPPLPLPGMETAFLADAPSIFSGPLRVGRDGDLLSLAVGTTSITLRSAF